MHYPFDSNGSQPFLLPFVLVLPLFLHCFLVVFFVFFSIDLVLVDVAVVRVYFIAVYFHPFYGRCCRFEIATHRKQDKTRANEDIIRSRNKLGDSQSTKSIHNILQVRMVW